MDKRLAGTWDLHDPSGYPQPVHRAVAEWAVRTPDALAISCADGTLHYRELDERANRLARHLRFLGVSRNSVVAIHLERGLDHYVALLAVLKAGGAALPLDSTHPTARLRFLLDDSAARVLLTRAALNTARGGAGRSTVVRVDADAARIAAHPPTAPPDEVGPVDPAYVLYIPASTGPPKGVLLQHGGIANLCRWHVAALGLTPADCGSLAAPPGFVTSIVDLWPPLVAGGRTVAIDDDIRADPARLVRTVREKRVTVCFLTTALAELFLAQPGLEDLPLRYLVTGGETLRRRPRPGLPFRLINTYGSTETTVYATSAVVEDTEQDSGAIPIGHPIGGVGVHLLDRTGRPVPAGEPGEIVITGPGVARGYVGRSELTARHFRPGAAGERRYHTGDLARRCADGALELLGRLDRQVKVRGHRIEPAEIERVLLRHPAVRRAAVAAVRPTADTAQLVAYVEPAPDWSPKPEPLPAAGASSAETDAGTLATIRALRTDALLEIGSGVAGADQACSSHHRAASIADLRDSPKGRFGAVLIDGFSTAHASLEDLLRVVTRAVELTVYGGAVVIAGVRPLPLLAAAYEAAELAEAAQEMPEAELAWRVQGRLLTDTELAVHPAAFTALADEIDRVATVSITPRCERIGVPRYDVVAHVGNAPVARAVSWLDWTGDELSLAAIRRLLLAGQDAIVGVRGIPASPRYGMTTPAPADLMAISAGGRYRCRLSAAAGRADGSLDAVWCRESVPDHHQIRWPGGDSVPESPANDPLRPLRDAALRRDLRTSLSERLAAHEIPDLFVVLDRLPLTPAAKVDRNALPLPHWVSGPRPGSDGPQTAQERAVTELLAGVLGRTRLGRTEDLRARGAHSLTFAQLAVRIAARFGVEVPVRQLSGEPTVAAIAGRIERAGSVESRRRTVAA